MESKPYRHIPRRMLKIRKDLLYRLRWPIFSPLDAIQITTGPMSVTFDQTTNRITDQNTSQTTLVPLFSSPLANEAIAHPPLTRVDNIYIAECKEKQGYYESHDVYDYKAPSPLTINNEDGNPITLGQFVTEVHTYYNDNMAAVKGIKAETCGVPNGSGSRTVTCGKPYLPDDVDFWFHRAHAVGIEERAQVSVEVVVEGEVWTRNGLERFWEMQLRSAGLNDMGIGTM